MSRKLSEPILDSGINSTNFFNGRLLTADALKTDQQANLEQRRLLGRAAGDGIVEGLEVKVIKDGGVGVQPVVGVSKGLALNRSGQVLVLHGDEQVALVRKLDAPPPTAGSFGDCADAISTFDTLENGFYLLVIGPASGFRERVPMRSLSDTASVTECGSRYRVEGTQFRLAPLKLSDMIGLSAATRAQINTLSSVSTVADFSKLRNLLAHACFGTEELSGVARDPLKHVQEQSAYLTYGAADFMRGRGELTDCEVPLALIYWRGGTLRFADMWSVRRRIYAHSSGRLSHIFPPRRVAEAEAIFFQFQEHLLWLVGIQPAPENIIAANFFRWLPAAGLLPVRNTANPVATTYQKFFLNKSFGAPTNMNGSKLHALFDESLAYPPFDLTGQDSVQLYSVKENTQAQTAASAPQPFVVFATQEMSYYSDQPRFPALCQTLRDTRDAYRNLIQKNVFLANALSPEALTPRLVVTSALQSVMSTASERHVSTCRCNCVLSREKGLAVMQDLYEVQKNLVAVLSTDWGRSFNAVGLKGFANLLKTYLDVAIPGSPSSRPSLKAAIAASNLNAALDAQNFINGMGGQWAGEAVTGNLDVTYHPPSSRGKTLVRTATGGLPNPPYRYTFRVTNKTNRALEIKVRAGFDAPQSEWDDGVTVISGDTVNLQPFNASNPNNPTAFSDVIVEVIPPSAQDASIGSNGTLRLVSSVDPPVNVSDDDSVDLTIGTKDAPEAATGVSILKGKDASGNDLLVIDGSPNAAPTNEPVTYTFKTIYSTATGPTPRNFRFFVMLDQPANANNLYTVHFDNKTTETDTGVNTATQKATLPYPMASGAQDEVQVSITPKAAAIGHPLTFRARLQAVDDVNLKDESQVFTITPVNNA
jgi:hypothetical protein